MSRVNVTDANWRLVARWCNEEIERLRDRLEARTDHETTQYRRGQIAALRKLLRDVPTTEFGVSAE